MLERTIEDINLIASISFSSFKLVKQQSPKANIFSYKGAEFPPLLIGSVPVIWKLLLTNIYPLIETAAAKFFFR
jgi:hypothetical protein